MPPSARADNDEGLATVDSVNESLGGVNNFESGGDASARSACLAVGLDGFGRDEDVVATIRAAHLDAVEGSSSAGLMNGLTAYTELGANPPR